ncbi:MAG TPA: hypothetical protein VGF59_02870 [Bryobacteraceae bacterium]|jgi:hypothetical protein
MPAREPIREDPILVQYLLGSLPEEETERLDELSIADEDFVWRLRAAENDLIDAYLHNELSGETLERFRSFYLASPRRREKVKFAEALQGLESGRPAADGWFAVPLMVPRWGIAAAAAVALFAIGLLVYDNARLREVARVSPAVLQVGAAAIVLMPPVRGGGPTPQVAIGVGDVRADFALKLETDDFPAYQVALKDSAGARVLWLSGELKSSRDAVSVSVPAGLLQPGDYLLELSSSGAGAQSIANYPFKALPR